MRFRFLLSASIRCLEDTFLPPHLTLQAPLVIRHHGQQLRAQVFLDRSIGINPEEVHFPGAQAQESGTLNHAKNRLLAWLKWYPPQP